MQFALDLDALSTEGAANTPRAPQLFRPIHYLGSKLRLAPAIADALDDVDASRGAVLDLFAGSGTTALALASHRTVIATDIQEYSRVLCSALLSKPRLTSDIVTAFSEKLQAGMPLLAKLRHAIEPLVEFEREALKAAAGGDAEQICALLESGSILAAERAHAAPENKALQKALEETVRRLSRYDLTGSAAATTVRYFGGAYFSYEQATELDCLSAIASEFSSDLSDLFTATLLSTASDLVNTVGKQFAQPIRPRTKQGAIKRHLLSKIERDRALDPHSTYIEWLKRYIEQKTSFTSHRVARADYRDALKNFRGRYSVVYADPPYTRDHYSRFYHVLETLALRDNPTIARNPGASDRDLSRGLYRQDRHQSPFCIKSKCVSAFRDLFHLASESSANLVLSYSPFESGAHPRLMQIDALVGLARQFYRSVELVSVTGVAHSKLNHSSLNLEKPEEAEVLLVCRLTP
ncbi:DNA adenine methylase [Cupriavidus pinatubonensis]|uniref:DNA adenine methylase n=1 Tax=Cupriavidus pinatubonensis TaxID=248026 RepID=UPI00112D1696|nr:DNA adenine methylase [Cupriavidus pinatubonensis]